jgi:hypothetical protein
MHSVQPHPGFHVKDHRSGKHFLVDTGAFCSIFPASKEDKSGSKTTNATNHLTAANGTPICTW